ncbi:DUF1652 domain-containing protein [Metapseudomonas resinovorans]|uniref:Uncharacterized protein n=1 Tax=Metapseudomonas resinovorans NBRC 106553 TaxID=1245471 RepID=S6AF02_METRE|nr:DUF1652 domain-containing protein [Pseudomonas resinovorans]BAN48407.1 hypothetical protein PCA10_26750 [Pseudomonas resinovorans NBRC 106553]
MRKRLEQRLQTRLSGQMPGHIVSCVIDMDGGVSITIEQPASGESWLISGIPMQSLVGRGAMERTVAQIIGEIHSLRGEAPLLLATDGNT